MAAATAPRPRTRLASAPTDPASRARADELTLASLNSMSAREAKKLIKESLRSTMAAMRASAAGAAGLARARDVSTAPVTAPEADVVDELQKGGPAFGDFVKSVGLGVAAAQAKLDETLVGTAKALSDTNIDVIAVFEQNIDDNGQLLDGNPVKMKLPLVNYLMPTAYQWTRVFLQSDMKVSEFNGVSGFHIQGKSLSASASARAGYSVFGGFSGSASGSVATTSYEYGAQASVSRDDAAGSLHLEATLEPRADIQLPKPFVLQKGPRLKVTSGSRTEISTTSGSPPVTTVTGRKVVLTAELKDKANNPLTGKTLEFKVGNPSLDYTVTPSSGQTDSNGEIQIEIRRTGAAFDPAKPPEPVVVRVWLGLVSQEVGINI